MKFLNDLMAVNAMVASLPDPEPNDKGEYETWRCPCCNHLNSALWIEECVAIGCGYPFKQIPISTIWTKEMPTNPRKREYSKRQRAQMENENIQQAVDAVDQVDVPPPAANNKPVNKRYVCMDIN